MQALFRVKVHFCLFSKKIPIISSVLQVCMLIISTTRLCQAILDLKGAQNRTTFCQVSKQSLLVKLMHVCLLVLNQSLLYRQSRKYLLLAGLWCLSKKPNMLTFGQPVISTICDLYQNGKCFGQSQPCKAIIMLIFI